MIHELKTHTTHFFDVALGIKTFEYRKNDRDYKVGDILCLKEYNPKTDKFGISQPIICKVTHMLQGLPKDTYGIPEGYCIMSIKVLK